MNINERNSKNIFNAVGMSSISSASSPASSPAPSSTPTTSGGATMSAASSPVSTTAAAPSGSMSSPMETAPVTMNTISPPVTSGGGLNNPVPPPAPSGTPTTSGGGLTNPTPPPAPSGGGTPPPPPPTTSGGGQPVPLPDVTTPILVDPLTPPSGSGDTSGGGGGGGSAPTQSDGTVAPVGYTGSTVSDYTPVFVGAAAGWAIGKFFVKKGDKYTAVIAAAGAVAGYIYATKFAQQLENPTNAPSIGWTPLLIGGAVGLGAGFFADKHFNTGREMSIIGGIIGAGIGYKYWMSQPITNTVSYTLTAATTFQVGEMVTDSNGSTAMVSTDNGSNSMTVSGFTPASGQTALSGTLTGSTSGATATINSFN